MGRARGQRNAAREKHWPGADAALVREEKRDSSRFDPDNRVCIECGGPRSYEASIRPGKCKACSVKRNDPSDYRERLSAEGAQIAATVDQEKFKNLIAVPDWQKRLVPLFLFRGTKPFHVLKMWNFTMAMLLAEVGSYRDAGALGMKSDLTHLCGAHANIGGSSVRSFFSRLRGAQSLTDSVPGLTEYVEWIHPQPCVLTPVSAFTNDPDCTVFWRTYDPWLNHLPTKPKVRPWKDKQSVADLQYPYIKPQAKPRDDAALLLAVHDLIPTRCPHDVRSDLCQDLVLSILAGEHTLGSIESAIPEFLKKARKLMPDRYGTVSLDDIVPGTDDLKYWETLHRTEPDFAPALIEDIAEREKSEGLPLPFIEEQEPRYRRVVTSPGNNAARKMFGWQEQPERIRQYRRTSKGLIR